MKFRQLIWMFLAILVVVYPRPSTGTELGSGISFRLPISCMPGKNCWIVNYVDADRTKNVIDYACGFKVYNKHKGTDFAVRDLAVMRRGFEVTVGSVPKPIDRGVPVVAAADGVVLGARNGLPDVNFRKIGGVKALKGKDCGNAVRIQHAGGWVTQYCHLRNKSVKVGRGTRVKAGQWLGFVGLSGRTEFPHLHFQVSRNKVIVDPFTGLSQGSGCGKTSAPLWNKAALKQLTYRPTNIYMGGFVGGGPKANRARAGNYHNAKVPRTAATLNLWADIFGLRKGDVLTFEIFAPNKTRLLAAKLIIRRTQIRKFFTAKKRRTAKLWLPGTYRGEIRLVRKLASGDRAVFRLTRTTKLR